MNVKDSTWLQSSIVFRDVWIVESRLYNRPIGYAISESTAKAMASDDVNYKISKRELPQISFEENHITYDFVVTQWYDLSQNKSKINENLEKQKLINSAMAKLNEAEKKALGL